MIVLLDTCVVLDFLQKREPFADAARRIFLAAAAEELTACITAKSATDIYYLMHRHAHSDQTARTHLQQLLTLTNLLDTGAQDIFLALSSGIRDFEDAVMIETAVRSHMDCIITRNVRDFTGAPVPVCTPDEFLQQFC